MGRPRKTEATKTLISDVKEVLNTEEILEEASFESEESLAIEEETAKEIETPDEISEKIVAIMRLYPQYEEMWITPRGFVHPVGTPQRLLKDAKLYKNKFYNK